jgi:maleate isomerase
MEMQEGGPVRKIKMEPARAFGEPPQVDEAAETLAAMPLHSICFGFTSSSYLSGAAAEQAMIQRLQERTRGIPVAVPCAAGVLALKTLGVTRLALVDPPWFPEEMTAKGKEYFESQGADVVFAACAGLPSGQYMVHPGLLFEWLIANVPTSADAIFVGGNGFRSIGVIKAIEEDLGLAMLTSNTAAFWLALGMAGTRAPVSNYGRIFSCEVPGFDEYQEARVYRAR